MKPRGGCPCGGPIGADDGPCEVCSVREPVGGVGVDCLMGPWFIWENVQFILLRESVRELCSTPRVWSTIALPQKELLTNPLV